MIECYMSVVNIGLLFGGGFGDYTEQESYGTQKYLVKYVVDVSFYPDEVNRVQSVGRVPLKCSCPGGPNFM